MRSPDAERRPGEGGDDRNASSTNSRLDVSAVREAQAFHEAMTGSLAAALLSDDRVEIVVAVEGAILLAERVARWLEIALWPVAA